MEFGLVVTGRFADEGRNTLGEMKNKISMWKFGDGVFRTSNRKKVGDVANKMGGGCRLYIGRDGFRMM